MALGGTTEVSISTPAFDIEKQILFTCKPAGEVQHLLVLLQLCMCLDLSESAWKIVDYSGSSWKQLVWLILDTMPKSQTLLHGHLMQVVFLKDVVLLQSSW